MIIIIKNMYRQGVGCITLNHDGLIIMFERKHNHKSHLHQLQFIQGGINKKESNIEAIKREIFEEIALLPHQYKIYNLSNKKFSYLIPYSINNRVDFIAQIQTWFIIKLHKNSKINLNQAQDQVFRKYYTFNNYDYILKLCIPFKKNLYSNLLKYLQTKHLLI